MRKTLLLTTIVFITTIFSTLAEKKTYTYNFKKPKITVDKQGFTEILYENCINYNKEGDPLLPHYNADILLPQSHEIVNINIITKTYYELTEKGVIIPASKQFPICKKAENYKVVKNEKIYSFSNIYPESAIGNYKTGFLSGHSIGSFSLCPVEYLPSKNQIKFIKKIIVEIETKETPKAQKARKFLRVSNNITKRINNIIDNPEALKSYNYKTAKNVNENDILLITNQELLPAFADYIQFKESTGFYVDAVTTEDIYATYSGVDNQEKIRNCIIDYYTNQGTSFVILGGDSDSNDPDGIIVPCRRFYINAGGEIDDKMPSDLYYCGLDGNWNTDNDDRWGEPGEDDLFAEVGIGRLCVDNNTEIQNFTNKLQMYQNSPVVDDIKKALFLGEELNNSPQTNGATYKEEIHNGSSNNGFTTVGLSPSFTLSTLYDLNFIWSGSDLFNVFNNTGINLLNHLGHSNPTYNMKISNSDVNTTNFTNDGITRGFVIGYSQGCYNGSFDNWYFGGYYLNEDCFAEKITGIATAEVACVANSRYGWYSPGATNSSSQYLDRQFFDAIFGENITTIGYVNSDSKEDEASYFNNDSYMRWSVYETNLFGDPSLDIWTDVPTNITANYVSETPIGTSQISFNTDAPYARIGLTQNNILIGRGIADENGICTVILPTPLIDCADINVSIIAHNRTRHQGTINVLNNIPFVIYNFYEINDQAGNANNKIDFGETIKLTLNVKNIGSQPANNVQVKITTDDPYITITDSVEMYGDFAAEDSITKTDAFTFIVAQNIPDAHNINFNVICTGQDSWTSFFAVNANAPVLTINNFVVSDPEGNNNGSLDPGETADIIFSTSNNGHSNAPNTIAELTTSNEYITINNSTYNFDTLSSGETDNAVFNVTIAQEGSLYSLVDFNYSVSSGEYTAAESYYTNIGMIMEDWETGDFSNFDWVFSGNKDWEITTSDVFDGIYSAKSGSVSNNQSSQLLISYSVLHNDSISFFRKVSSENTYDFLQFYIDYNKVGEWSGEKDWEKVSFAVSPGSHIFKWKYVKDPYVSNGSDCGWIDNISFPAPLIVSANAGNNDTICENNTYTLQATASNYETLHWTTSGDGTFDNDTALNPVYIHGDNDVLNGFVTLSLLAHNSQAEDKTDEMLLTINKLPTAEIISNDTSICKNDSTFIEFAFTGTGPWNFAINDEANIFTTETSQFLLHVAPLENTVYKLISVSDSNSCSNVCNDSININVYPLPVIDLGVDTSMCNYESITLDAGEGFASYLWSNGSTEQSVFVDSSNIGTGDTLYWVEVSNEQGCSMRDSINISFKDCTGISNINENIFVKVFPNPNNGNFNLVINTNENLELNVKVINTFGITVFQDDKVKINNKYHKSYNLNNLNSGIYYIYLYNNEHQIIKKIFINK